MSVKPEFRPCVGVWPYGTAGYPTIGSHIRKKLLTSVPKCKIWNDLIHFIFRFLSLTIFSRVGQCKLFGHWVGAYWQFLSCSLQHKMYSASFLLCLCSNPWKWLHLISLFNITPESNNKVMRIKEMIINWRTS